MLCKYQRSKINFFSSNCRANLNILLYLLRIHLDVRIIIQKVINCSQRQVENGGKLHRNVFDDVIALDLYSTI